MHASVRQYQLVPGTVEEFNRRVNEGFVPLVRDAKGFVSYQGVDAGNGSWLSITVFETEEGADQSAKIAGDFVEKNLQEMIQGSPTVVTGNLVASARA
jgi:hypothetical protein